MTVRLPISAGVPVARSSLPHRPRQDPSPPLPRFRSAMGERNIRFRLGSSHPAPDRPTHDPVADFPDDSRGWQPQQPCLSMPGFRLFPLLLLLCPHVHPVARAREKALSPHRVEADFIVTTGSDWIVASVEGDFRIRQDAAAAGQERALADDDVIAHRQERIRLCPVSRNLPESVRKGIDITTLRRPRGGSAS